MKYPVIERFEKAIREHEVRGTYPPSERVLIEKEYKQAKKDLESVITNAINLQIIPAIIPKE